ncbi:hypothetical protein BV25DRAFT_1919874 [Artomyces pyxidatus]|uniref:Uncharacterized protein n=1 Tax=Artomyces pyxidatus TaxID=48021 RepID=A0ACB8SNS5_9AGAM|nr:hypothetical protein BV25DRAFT_1919874 [Artomyces pyxidatus]
MYSCYARIFCLLSTTMWFPRVSLPGLAAQVPFLSSSPPTVDQAYAQSPVARNVFAFQDGNDTLTPKDLIELARPGVGIANTAGDLVLVPVSKRSFEDKRSGSFLPCEPPSNPQASLSKSSYPVAGKHSGLIHARSATSSLYVIALTSTAETLDAEPGILLGIFPTGTVSNVRYASKAGFLVFSDDVYADGSLTRALGYLARPQTALALHSFTVQFDRNQHGHWQFGGHFVNVLKDAGHHTPVEPFGGIDDFDVSEMYIVYTTKDPKLPEAWHTKKNIYLVDFSGNESPRELTSGRQGATHNPVFNKQGDMLAWLELDEDGYESDRSKVVIYDLKKNVRYTLTQSWDSKGISVRLQFSADSSFLYLTAGDFSRIKVFVLRLPETPDVSTTHPDFPPSYTNPQPLTNEGFASRVQALPNGRVLFTRSSRLGPNDVFILRGLGLPQVALSRTQEPVLWHGAREQVTRFTAEYLQTKGLGLSEDFFFERAEGNSVHGYVLKPKGPQDVWGDQWSVRMNPAIFAQQGYFAVMINHAGSSTFGQAFTDAIIKDYGGRPFVDIQKGWEHVLRKYPGNQDRAVATGGSWGGYAINWIQGHPEYNFKFKALLNHDFGGVPWEPKTWDLLREHNPAEIVHKWSTPQLVMYGSKDYRVPETEAMAAFHTL